MNITMTPSVSLGFLELPVDDGRASTAATVTADILSAKILTRDGQYVAGGTAHVRTTASGWSATLRSLDRPGTIASLYYAECIRDVTIRLEDGRCARCRITSTTFVGGRERVCDVTGVEPFA